MRVDEPITYGHLLKMDKTGVEDINYINQLRVDRLMRASKYWHLYASHWECDIDNIKGNSIVEIEAREWRRCRALRARLLAEAYEARAKRIKEGV